MIRALRLAVLGLIALLLFVVALANRAAVSLKLLPDDIANLLGRNWQIDLPLFVVVFAGVALGLLIGFLWEWLREHKHRADVSVKSRELARMERELAALRDAKGQPQDEVLALLDTKNV